MYCDDFVCEYYDNNNNVKLTEELDGKMKELSFCACVETYFSLKHSGVVGFNFDGWMYNEIDMENKLKAMTYHGNIYAISVLQNYFGIRCIREDGQLYFIKQ